MSNIWRWLRNWIWNLTDALPPYGRAEGPLEFKREGGDGKHYIRVASVRIQVDRTTFEKLSPGDELIVRHTKGLRAVNIDVVRPPDNVDTGA